MFATPREDFEKNTLNSIPGILGKLEYLAQLREENGRYYHWGLARIHGDHAAMSALEQIHLSQFLALLRTPLPQLWDEIEGIARDFDVEQYEYVDNLMRCRELLVPPLCGGGSERHFSSVLLALSALAAAQGGPHHRAA